VFRNHLIYRNVSEIGSEGRAGSVGQSKEIAASARGGSRANGARMTTAPASKEGFSLISVTIPASQQPPQRKCGYL